MYGTLQDTQIQTSIIGRNIKGQSDSLDGYRINALLLPPYPVAMPDEDSTITGQVLAVTSAELQQLDEYEGECYLRINVWLNSGKEAWLYIGNPSCYPEQDI